MQTDVFDAVSGKDQTPIVDCFQLPVLQLESNEPRMRQISPGAATSKVTASRGRPCVYMAK